MRDLELAQTNIQLCRQLLARGWSDDDLAWIRSAYELAMQLYSGQFRANGKTQIAHHVGVASALAMANERTALVVAGMVHSAYFVGEFGNGRQAVNADKRARVRSVVGPEIEALVHNYTELPWNVDSLQDLRDAGSPSATTRDAVAMRLANEVDEHADAITRFCTVPHDAGLVSDKGRALFDEVAAVYRLDELRAMLGAVLERSDELDVPAVLQTTAKDSLRTAPASHRRRVHIVLQDSRLGHEIAARVPGARTLAERVRRVVS
jgi:hypothetical protein